MNEVASPPPDCDSTWIKIADLEPVFHVTRRTLDRWRADPAYKFPRSFNVGERIFFLRRDVEAWKAMAETEGVRR